MCLLKGSHLADCLGRLWGYFTHELWSVKKGQGGVAVVETNASSILSFAFSCLCVLSVSFLLFCHVLQVILLVWFASLFLSMCMQTRMSSSKTSEGMSNVCVCVSCTDVVNSSTRFMG